MASNKFLDELAAKIGEAIRSNPAKDLEKNVRAGLGSMFSKLDLVTRDEFEVQAQLLLRTRERLEALEEKLRAMEQERAATTGGAATPGGPGAVAGSAGLADPEVGGTGGTPGLQGGPG